MVSDEVFSKIRKMKNELFSETDLNEDQIANAILASSVDIFDLKSVNEDGVRENLRKLCLLGMKGT